jgi:hypothetical protein
LQSAILFSPFLISTAQHLHDSLSHHDPAKDQVAVLVRSTMASRIVVAADMVVGSMDDTPNGLITMTGMVEV